MPCSYHAIASCYQADTARPTAGASDGRSDSVVSLIVAARAEVSHSLGALAWALAVRCASVHTSSLYIAICVYFQHMITPGHIFEQIGDASQSLLEPHDMQLLVFPGAASVKNLTLSATAELTHEDTTPRDRDRRARVEH